MPSKKPPVSKQAKAGLTFPVSRTNRTLKARSLMKRVGGSAPVYLAAVVEYIAHEVLEVAGNHTRASKRKRVTPQDVIAGIRGDGELATLFSHIATYTGDKLDNVNGALHSSAPAPAKPTEEAEVE
jgi:histone H2A